jgi:site-specific recombinase XerD
MTLRRLDLVSEVFHMKEPSRVPLILSQDETKRLLEMAGCLRDRLLLSLGYGAGLRAGEVTRLRVKHIDSAQNIICASSSRDNASPIGHVPPQRYLRRCGCALFLHAIATSFHRRLSP